MRKPNSFSVYDKFRFLCCKNGWTRARFLKKKDIFHEFGDKVFFYSRKIPSEPYLISIHNNVHISANVTFITHDTSCDLLKNIDGEKYKYFMGTVEIFDNVLIGANSTILYNVKIGPNAIVAAGSVVVKDVPPNTIVGGNPAKIIGKFDDFARKRRSFMGPSNLATLERIDSFYWSGKS